MSTVFHKIISGDIPAAKIYEDEKILSFMDAFPQTKGHALIIAKKSTADIFEMPEDSLTAIILFSKKLALAQKQLFNPDGIKVMQFNGAAAGQSVFYYHMHLIPAYENTHENKHASKAVEFAQLSEQAQKLAEIIKGMNS